MLGGVLVSECKLRTLESSIRFDIFLPILYVTKISSYLDLIWLVKNLNR